ncbi:ferredoxin [Streptomyces sp. 3211.6]|uniref:ferredoxin n=1 Tax=Streptomyces TaxID=1883 RepID=UPI0009A48413|nr:MULTISPECIES: ferredoxin [Streptomyces]RKT08007.1 ferredoxin [Streptomyces sp. 3211.6]RPF44374.1 ferredoxin [Streptomyces sp. Ag109_G2-6]
MSPARLGVDRERCIGAGMCAMTAPGVFDQDPDDGLVVLLRTDPAPDRLAAARMAAGVCPSGAITVTGPESEDGPGDRSPSG